MKTHFTSSYSSCSTYSCVSSNLFWLAFKQLPVQAELLSAPTKSETSQWAKFKESIMISKNTMQCKLTKASKFNINGYH